mmetsp:Transcript_13208/g.33266  ORF Transcript_13208/g.33266 Transcript_13208/m.33266 type:complete len:382 (-) Transcript_13208:265-1410(-)
MSQASKDLLVDAYIHQIFLGGNVESLFFFQTLLFRLEFLVGDGVVLRPVHIVSNDGRPAALLDGILSSPGGPRSKGLPQDYLSRRVDVVFVAQNELDEAAVIGDAIAPLGFGQCPIDHGLLVFVGSVGNQPVGRRQIVRRKGPVLAHFVALGLPPDGIVHVAPGEGVSAKEFVGPVSHQDIREALLLGLLKCGSDHERVSDRHPVPHLAGLDGLWEVNVDQIFWRHLDDDVALCEIVLPGSIFRIQFVGARLANDHRDRNVKYYPQRCCRLQYGTGIDAPRQNQAQSPVAGGLALSRFDAVNYVLRGLGETIFALGCHFDSTDILALVFVVLPFQSEGIKIDGLVVADGAGSIGRSIARNCACICHVCLVQWNIVLYAGGV